MSRRSSRPTTDLVGASESSPRPGRGHLRVDYTHTAAMKGVTVGLPPVATARGSSVAEALAVQDLRGVLLDSCGTRLGLLGP